MLFCTGGRKKIEVNQKLLKITTLGTVYVRDVYSKLKQNNNDDKNNNL